MRSTLRAVIVGIAAVAAGVSAAHGQGGDDLEALSWWSYLHHSTSATVIKPSDAFCGKKPKSSTGGPCDPNGNVYGGRAQEHVEIRGWVVEVDGHDHPPCQRCGDETCQDEYRFDILLDHDWTPEASGVYPINTPREVNLAVTPVNLMVWGDGSVPIVHVEVDGWGRGRMCHQLRDMFGRVIRTVDTPAPDDWRPVPENKEARWSFDPGDPPSMQPGLLQKGDYVRAVGTLWEDSPHGMAGCWAGRGWLELHPVDFLARLDPPPPHATTFKLIAICGTTAIGGVDHDIFPPGPRPSATATVGFEEIPDSAFTLWDSVQPPTGSRVKVMSDRIRVHLSLREGKFKAAYVVFWRQ